MRRFELLESIADTIIDYRKGSIQQPSVEHVERWVNQFEPGVQLGILSEMDFVLKNSYISFDDVINYMEGIYHTEKLAGPNPSVFWKSVEFLDIQERGNSQKEMIKLFGYVIDHFTQEAADFEKNGQYVYLDDAIFSGNRVLSDLRKWINNHAPQQCIIHIIAIGIHTNGEWYAKRELEKTIRDSGKSVQLNWWRHLTLENMRQNRNISDVLWPSSIPCEAQNHVDQMKYKPTLRSGSNVGRKAFFSNPEGRNLLEQEFLKAGIKILSQCPNLDPRKRPLGHSSLETLGFGSPIVTFRNCPNNTPLVFWVGSPWYPLLPRVSNTETSLKRAVKALNQAASR